MSSTENFNIKIIITINTTCFPFYTESFPKNPSKLNKQKICSHLFKKIKNIENIENIEYMLNNHLKQSIIYVLGI